MLNTNRKLGSIKTTIVFSGKPSKAMKLFRKFCAKESEPVQDALADLVAHFLVHTVNEYTEEEIKELLK